MTVPDPDQALRAYLYADPAAHSLSPHMHAAAFAHAGLNGTYEARRVLPADLPQAVQALRSAGTLGANLSLPHKESVLPLLDDLSSAARLIGAVNTIVHRGGQLSGDNTDAPGLLAALRDAGLDDAGRGSVVILGAGGAARAAAFVALRNLARPTWVVNRTLGRAQALAADFSDLGSVQAAPATDVPWEAAQVVINASSAGLNAPDETPLPAPLLNRLPAGALIYDMVYKPAETRLIREAHARGLRAHNGLGMLAHQARLAFQAWTGTDVPVQVFLDALRAAGAPR